MLQEAHLTTFHLHCTHRFILSRGGSDPGRASDSTTTTRQAASSPVPKAEGTGRVPPPPCSQHLLGGEEEEGRKSSLEIHNQMPDAHQRCVPGRASHSSPQMRFLLSDTAHPVLPSIYSPVPALQTLFVCHWSLPPPSPSR